MFVNGLMVVACTAPPPAREVQQPEPPPPTQAEPVQPPMPQEEQPGQWGFDAVVRAAELRDGGKGMQFRGVRLEQSDGDSWIATYRPEGWLRAFDGRAVHVTGWSTVPTGRALVGAQHFRIATLTVKDRQGGLGPLFAAGPEQTLVGRLSQAQGAVGSKGEGETYPTFQAADGTSYLLGGWPEEPLEYGPAVEVLARKVEPDMSYRARRGGDYLWILEIKKL